MAAKVGIKTYHHVSKPLGLTAMANLGMHTKQHNPTPTLPLKVPSKLDSSDLQISVTLPMIKHFLFFLWHAIFFSPQPGPKIRTTLSTQMKLVPLAM